MDKEFQEHTTKSLNYLHVQASVLGAMIHSLVATHPKPAELHQDFAHRFAALQTGPLMTMGDEELRDLARQVADSLLQR